VKRYSRLQDLQWRAEFGVLRATAAFFRALPLTLATDASAFCWRRLAPIVNPKRHKRALENLAIAFPEKSEAERREIALKHWENLGRVMVETMRIGLFGRGKVGEHGDDQKTARAIMDFVRRGGRLALVCDLYDRTGIPVPFFGKEAKTQAIAAIVARRVGARMWMSRAKRIGTESRFEIEIKELRVPRTADQSADVRWAMVHMQKVFEAWIRETPEQWMWSNRRWS
jgi:lauroyl/myristoyl acyltransferase